MLYEFKLIHNTAEATKNLCCAKCKGAVDPNEVTRWVKKFCSTCKTSTISQRSGWPKTILQATAQILRVALGKYQESSVSH